MQDEQGLSENKQKRKRSQSIYEDRSKRLRVEVTLEDCLALTAHLQEWNKIVQYILRTGISIPQVIHYF